MNEIKQIHLGRNAFTIALDAHGELRTYLAAIKKRAGDDVTEEVELRMAELLTERGFDDKKVVLKSDVDYLQQQLGEPKDFGDDAEEDVVPAETTEAARHLYRDTENGWLGGVASGIAAFFGVQAWVIRLLFVLFAWAGGAGVLLYIVLWILVPEAKTPSDRLRMQGKPVTVDTLKEFVENSGLKDNLKDAGKEMGAKTSQLTTGAGTAASRAIRMLVRTISACIGMCLLIAGIAGMLYTVSVGSYMLFNPDHLFDVGRIFPIGSSETTFMVIALSTAALSMLFLAIVGLAMIRRRWPIPVWLTAGLVSLFLVGGAIGTPMGLTVVPKVVDRYEALRTTETKTVPAFSNLVIDTDHSVQVEYQQANEYQVIFIAAGKVRSDALKATVSNGILTIAAHNWRANTDCGLLCIHTEDLHIVVKAPELKNTKLLNGPELLMPDYVENSQPITPHTPRLLYEY